MSEHLIGHPCSRTFPHEPHVWISALVGGEPGPVPQVTCMCPGVEVAR